MSGRPPGQASPPSPQRPPGVWIRPYAPAYTVVPQRTTPYSQNVRQLEFRTVSSQPQQQLASLALHQQYVQQLEIQPPIVRTVRNSQILSPEVRNTLRVRVKYPQAEDDWGEWSNDGYEAPPWRQRPHSPQPRIQPKAQPKVTIPVTPPRAPAKAAGSVSSAPEKAAGPVSSAPLFTASNFPKPPLAPPPPPPQRTADSSDGPDLDTAAMREHIYGKTLASMAIDQAPLVPPPVPPPARAPASSSGPTQPKKEDATQVTVATPTAVDFKASSISSCLDQVLEQATKLLNINTDTLRQMHSAFNELHNISGCDPSFYEDILQESKWTVFQTATHDYFGLQLQNMTGEDEKPASSCNFVYCFVHGTTPGGSAAIVRSRLVKRSHSDEDSDFLTWGFNALAAWDTAKQASVQNLLGKLVRMGKGQSFVAVSGIAQHTQQHATRDAGTTGDDQRDAALFGIVHHRPSGRWCIREDLAKTDHLWFVQAKENNQIVPKDLRRPISTGR